MSGNAQREWAYSPVHFVDFSGSITKITRRSLFVTIRGLLVGCGRTKHVNWGEWGHAGGSEAGGSILTLCLSLAVLDGMRHCKNKITELRRRGFISVKSSEMIITSFSVGRTGWLGRAKGFAVIRVCLLMARDGKQIRMLCKVIESSLSRNARFFFIAVFDFKVDTYSPRF